MKQLNIFILCIIIVILFFYLKNIFIRKNSYLGINTKCNYCKNNTGVHYHFLSTKLYPKFKNMASSGVECQYCVSHQNEFHFHYLE